MENTTRFAALLSLPQQEAVFEPRIRRLSPAENESIQKNIHAHYRATVDAMRELLMEISTVDIKWSEGSQCVYISCPANVRDKVQTIVEQSAYTYIDNLIADDKSSDIDLLSTETMSES